ncbi:MAG TPA: hypothetical protein VG962_11495 [Steroidobacteraceae bacterium]|nr:hypothetical protein [Steroidobacteraceae bacterium]
MMKLHRMQSKNGFALVAALFLIIVLAALGLFATKIAGTQEQSIDLELLGARAQAAANSGIEYAANRALMHNKNCVNTTLNLNQAALQGFVVTIGCTRSNHTMTGSAPTCNGNNCQAYELTATATYGTYGTANYVSRQQRRTVTNTPPLP